LRVKTIGMKKTPFNKALIYDDNCPLCKAYTSAFVRTGFLQEENRVAFSDLKGGEFLIDWKKARHEIPLVDRDTREVVYGVDALATILQQQWGFVAFFMKIKPVYWFFKKLYKLISYNRRLIVADTQNTSCGIDCRPDFNLKYRVLLILFLLAISSIAAWGAGLLYQLPYAGIILFFLLLIPFFSFANSRKRLLDIATHYSISLLIAAFLLLLTALLKNFFSNGNSLVSATGIAVTIGITIKQINKRKRFIKLSAVDEMQ
jgi:predicted DCC family thiol-disulfide oxidoreductase YuxK